MTKVCGGIKGCGLSKPVTEFYMNKKRGAYGLSCKQCISEARHDTYIAKFGRQDAAKKCSSCGVSYKGDDKRNNFPTYGKDGEYLHAYCKKPECKIKYTEKISISRKATLLVKNDKGKQMRINIIRAKFIDWQMNYPKEMK